MLNNEIELRTSAEVCTQIASYFDIVDNCIQLSDTNKQYTISPQTSYSPSPPIPQGSYTSVIISPNTNNTADLYNGFIKADMEIMLKEADGDTIADTLLEIDTEISKRFNKVWFGFKDARDAVEKYEIVANGITIYTQNFGCEESFLTSLCANETTKRADIYSKARHKDIWKNTYGNRCGVVVNFTEKWYEKKYKIHLKIDLRRFLPLSNIKYLPAFAGKMELRLYFSCAGMVCAPIGPGVDFENMRNYNWKYYLDDITNEFTPIGERIKMFVKLPSEQADSGAINATQTSGSDTSTVSLAINYKHFKAEYRTFQVSEYAITECSSIIPTFGLDDNIYNMLVQRYSDPSHPLTFPTQTIAIYTTTNTLKNSNDKATCTITPRFCDSIFCLFPLKHTHHTWFKNPQFKSFQLNCGGYGNIPGKAFGTTSDYPEFIEYCQNALNMNGEQSGFNKEVVASLTNQQIGNSIGNYPNDRTSFFIALPTETDGTYQQGLTSLSPINFEINVSQETGTGTYADLVKTPPLICLLFDSSISILVSPNGMPPLVRLGNYDLTTPQ